GRTDAFEAITARRRPAAESCRGRGMRSGAGSNRSEAAGAAHALPDNRAAPARDKGKPARIRTRTREVGARDASVYTTDLYEADDPARTGLSGLATRCA